MINDESLLSCQVSGRHRRVIERGGGEGSGEGGGKHLVPFRLSPTLPSQNETISDGKSCQESNGNIFRDTDSLMTNSSRSVASHPRIRGPVSLINDDEPRRSSLLLPAAPPARSRDWIYLTRAIKSSLTTDRDWISIDKSLESQPRARRMNLLAGEESPTLAGADIPLRERIPARPPSRAVGRRRLRKLPHFQTDRGSNAISWPRGSRELRDYPCRDFQAPLRPCAGLPGILLIRGPSPPPI